MRAASRVVCLALALGWPGSSSGQAVSQRGFVEGTAVLFPQAATNDDVQAVVDLFAREDVFVQPASWLRLAGGVELRANSHDQVEASWRMDVSDRGRPRPRLSLRRLSATLTRGAVTVDVGKQFIRWGKTDLVNPTDRFAPRDFMDVVESEFLAVTAVRGVVQHGPLTIDAVITPRFTPSRIPLLEQRWAVLPPEAAGIVLHERPASFPDGWQGGLRYGQVADRFEYSLSYFHGFNHLPTLRLDIVDPSPQGRVDVAPEYPPMRSYGADVAVPGPWFTIKGEAAYFTSTSHSADEYILYVAQLERQRGEWVFVGGYAGEVVTRRRSLLTFAPDRGMSRAFMSRASYTLDANRSVAFEGAVRQSADGAYLRAEYSQARGAHWRATIAGVAIMGDADDFFGQYRRNSHVAASIRYSF